MFWISLCGSNVITRVLIRKKREAREVNVRVGEVNVRVTQAEVSMMKPLGAAKGKEQPPLEPPERTQPLILAL